jgi:UDP-glucuronate 4-epimerase
MRCLVTGTAGFIGFHLARRLIADGHEVFGVDGMTPYYDVRLKEARVAQLERHNAFHAHRCMLEDSAGLVTIFREAAPELVVHLAAQAGVRYSLKNPRAYVESNVVGSFNIIELCREYRPRHLVMASTSSAYGASATFPLVETGSTDHPLTIYAATKKSMETMAHSYAHLWDIPTTIFRFFTAYGPWGRPDMALFKFVENILAGRPIDIYNHGRMERDFTYVDDLIDSISPVAPYRIVNIGGGRPVGLLRFVEAIEETLGRKAERNYMDMQAGDVLRTEASTELLEALIGFRPATPIEVGVDAFVRWYRDYYGV